jgi:hypothetical protein
MPIFVFLYKFNLGLCHCGVYSSYSVSPLMGEPRLKELPSSIGRSILVAPCK